MVFKLQSAIIHLTQFVGASNSLELLRKFRQVVVVKSTQRRELDASPLCKLDIFMSRKRFTMHIFGFTDRKVPDILDYKSIADLLALNEWESFDNPDYSFSFDGAHGEPHTGGIIANMSGGLFIHGGYFLPEGYLVVRDDDGLWYLVNNTQDILYTTDYLK